MSVFFESPDQKDGSPYLDATITWDFDSWDFATNTAKHDVPDPLKSTNGRRYASGFLAAHVFEKPGQYRVSARRYDAQGVTDLGQKDITVLRLDQDSQPWRTVYVAFDADADPNSAGTSHTSPMKTTLKNAIENLAKAYTRVRIRKPTKATDVFKFDAGVESRSPGPVIVDSYDPTAIDNFLNNVPNAKKDDPNDPGTSDDTNAPNLQNQEVNGSWNSITIGEDWRIMNLKVSTRGTKGSSGSSGDRYPGGVCFNASNALIYRVEQSNLHASWMSPTYHYNTVAECKFHDLSGTGYVGNDKPAENTHGALIGNWVYNMTADDLQHVFRIQSAQRYFIAFNEFGPGTKSNYDGLTIRGNTERIIVYRNIIHDDVTGIWPQGRNNYDEKQRYVVLESNLFSGEVVRNTAIAIHAKDIVIRNNILVNFSEGIVIGDDTVVGPSTNIKVYNNTFISNDAEPSYMAVQLGDGCTADIYNNILWAGTKTDTQFLYQMLTRTTETTLWSNPDTNHSDYNVCFGSAPVWNGSGPSTLFPGNRTLAKWQADGTAMVVPTATSTKELDTHSRLENPNLNPVPLIKADPNAVPATGTIIPEQYAQPKADTNARVSSCKDLPGVALDFNGRLRSHPTQCGAVAFTPSAAPVTSP